MGLSAQTCSQSWEGDGAEVFLLTELQHGMNHCLDPRGVFKDDNVDDVFAGQRPGRRQDH